MYYVYALFSREDNKFYIGYTENLQRRLKEHQAGYNYTTARYKNQRVIFAEIFVNEQDARRREKYFKTTKGRKALRLILRGALTTYRKNLACPVV